MDEKTLRICKSKLQKFGYSDDEIVKALEDAEENAPATMALRTEMLLQSYRRTALIIKRKLERDIPQETEYIDPDSVEQIDDYPALAKFLCNYLDFNDQSNHIQRAILTANKSLTLLKLITDALEDMRDLSENGELFHLLLDYTYINEETAKYNIKQICRKIEDVYQPTNYTMSIRNYYNVREKAINDLSNILFGDIGPYTWLLVIETDKQLTEQKRRGRKKKTG